MKIKDGFILREVAGSSIVVAVGDAVKEFKCFFAIFVSFDIISESIKLCTKFD